MTFGPFVGSPRMILQHSHHGGGLGDLYGLGEDSCPLLPCDEIQNAAALLSWLV